MEVHPYGKAHMYMYVTFLDHYIIMNADVESVMIFKKHYLQLHIILSSATLTLFLR